MKGGGCTKSERFLPKIQHPPKIFQNFENWIISGEPQYLAKIRIFKVGRFDFSCKKTITSVNQILWKLPARFRFLEFFRFFSHERFFSLIGNFPYTLTCNMHQSHLAVRISKRSPSQETDLGNWGRLKVLNDTKLILNN